MPVTIWVLRYVKQLLKDMPLCGNSYQFSYLEDWPESSSLSCTTPTNFAIFLSNIVIRIQQQFRKFFVIEICSIFFMDSILQVNEKSTKDEKKSFWCAEKRVNTLSYLPQFPEWILPFRSWFRNILILCRSWFDKDLLLFLFFCLIN